MKNRSPIAVALLGIIPFYSIYWYVVTAGEMRQKGADVPTALLLIVPLANIWWLFKYSQAVEHVTGGKMTAMLTFIMLWFIGFIGQAIVQDSFNNAGTTPAMSGPSNPVGGPSPMSQPMGMPVAAPMATDQMSAPAPQQPMPMAPQPLAPAPATPMQPPAAAQQPPTDPTNV